MLLMRADRNQDHFDIFAHFGELWRTEFGE